MSQILTVSMGIPPQGRPGAGPRELRHRDWDWASMIGSSG